MSTGSTGSSPERLSARAAIVDQHVYCENAHDLDAVLSTFGQSARYDDEPSGEHYEGLKGVHTFYSQLMHAIPDLQIIVLRRHVTNDTIVLEVTIRGTYLGQWRGLPPTGRKVNIPLCGIYTFDSFDRLQGERIYYDRATVLRQLGVFHEPQSLTGRVCTVATHPITFARALLVKLRRARFAGTEMRRHQY